MSNLYCFFVALWIACTTAVAYDVVELDGAHFELIQSEYHYIAVLFYDSSPFGEKLKKEWVEGMKLVDQSLPVGCEVAMINVEEKELKEFLASNEIGVPSVKTFRKGVISDYQGAVDRSEIANYITRDTKPAVELVSSVVELESVFKSNKRQGMVFGLFKHQDIPHSKNEESTKYEYQMWNHYVLTAETLRGYINFYYVTSNAMLSVFGVTEYIQPIALMILPNENISVFDGEIIHSSLLEWVFKQAVPGNKEIGVNSTLGELHTNHFFISQKKKFILFCTEDMLSADSPLLQQWQELSQSYQDHAIFSYLSNLEFGTLGDYFKIRSIDELPVIVSLASNLKFKSNTINLFNSKSHMNEFVSQVLNGTARQLLLSSELIPTTQRGTVFQVVADNMFDIVGDPKRDVLLVLYTAWCKVCQHFIPILELVGRAVKAENRIRIAKINIEANDIPSEWKVLDSSIPTLLYFPAADKPYSNQVPIPRLFWNVEPGLYEIIAFLQRESSFDPSSLNIATNTQLNLIMNDEEEILLQYLEEEHFFRRNEKRITYEDTLVDWAIGEVVFDGKRWHIAGGLFLCITWLAMLLYILKTTTNIINKEKGD